MKKRIQFSGSLAVPALTLLMMSAMGMTALAARGWVVENNEYGVANYDWYMDASGSTVSSYYYSTEEKCYLKTGNATIKLVRAVLSVLRDIELSSAAPRKNGPVHLQEQMGRAASTAGYIFP